ncbi:MAG: DEAD/DEAH box helicase [Porcipelethomonas sp.]
MRFDEIGLSEEILRATEQIGFTEMTEIQEKSIPVILEGKDVIGRSNTGTGKTAAFGIPAVEKIKKDSPEGVKTLILCPTRELAVQAADEIKKFSQFMPWVKVSAVYGGAAMDRQIRELKRGANIVVGTPGRVMDHIRRRTLKLERLETIILDEADEMLNMGFREDIEEILQYVPEERQTILFSATMPPEIMAITENYQKSPVVIKTLSKSRTVEAIDQSYYAVSSGKKADALYVLWLYNAPKSSMVFCNTKKMVDELTEFLASKGVKAAGIHGDMKQLQRTTVMNSFKSGRINVLVATDVAARGIDVSGVDAVFNFDLPQDNEYYIHRIGRTGRAGKSGKAYTLVSGRKQVYAIKALAKYTKSEITEQQLPDKSEIIGSKLEAFAERIENYCQRDIVTETDRLFEILAEKGISAEQIARALCSRKISKELKNIPEVHSETYKTEKRSRKGGNGKTVKVDINIGRMHKIAPNYILGALVDATGMSGKDFGKIDIHDRHTTVEVPDSESGYIIDSMKNSRINGNKVTVRLYEPSGRNRNYREKNSGRGKKGPNRNGGYGNGKKRYSGSHKKR